MIAITSAETYRALQTRTSDLQESLEYQTATSDVLKVISRSTFDLQPVLDTVVETAARLCDADQAAIIRHENGIIEMAANSGFPPEYEAVLKELGPHRLVVDAPMVAYRAINERRVVHIHDVAAVPGYAVERNQTWPSSGPRLVCRCCATANRSVPSCSPAERVEPFTDRQIELVSTFADQAVIAIENTRLITEQREALEQQTATAEVLQVINASPGDLAPVFDAMLEKAHASLRCRVRVIRDLSTASSCARLPRPQGTRTNTQACWRSQADARRIRPFSNAVEGERVRSSRRSLRRTAALPPDKTRCGAPLVDVAGVRTVAVRGAAQG